MKIENKTGKPLRVCMFHWIPAFAGKTALKIENKTGKPLRVCMFHWIPAFAGKTDVGVGTTAQRRYGSDPRIRHQCGSADAFNQERIRSE